MHAAMGKSRISNRYLHHLHSCRKLCPNISACHRPGIRGYICDVELLSAKLYFSLEKKSPISGILMSIQLSALYHISLTQRNLDFLSSVCLPWRIQLE